MLGAVGRGRGRAKLLENGPPAPLRRPRERTSVAAAGGEPAPPAEPAPAPQRPLSGPVPAPQWPLSGLAPQQVPGAPLTQLRRPTGPPSAAAQQPIHSAQNASVWANVAVPGQSAALSRWPGSGLNPHSASFVPVTPPARPVSDSLVSPEDWEWGSEVDSESDPPVNHALVTDVPDPQNAYQSMIYNNIVETLWNMACVPASFDRQGVVLVDNLNGWLPSSGIPLTVVLDFMLNQVAYVPAFGYVCAKLCHLMCTRCRVTECGRTFRDLLLSRCQSLYMQAATLLAESAVFFADLTVLFCELYLHVRLAGGEEPIAVLGSAVLGLCAQLMDDVTPERVTAVCQALKLTGAALERQMAAALDWLMERVRSAAFDGRLPRDERHSLLQLITLQASQWGGMEGLVHPVLPQETARPLQGYSPADPSSGLSNEERWFLEQQLQSADDEDDDELDEAYDAFLEELDQSY